MGIIGSIGDTIDDVVDSVTGGTEGEEAADQVSNPPSGSTGGSSAGSSGGSSSGGSSGGGQTEAEAAAPSVSDPSSGGGSSPSPGGSSGGGGGSGGGSSGVPSYDLGGGSSAGSSGGSSSGGSSGGGQPSSGGAGRGGDTTTQTDDFDRLKRTNATVEREVREELPELNQQVQGRDLDRTDVQVGRTSDGQLAIRPELLGQINTSRPRFVQAEPFGQVTDTGGPTQQRPTARAINKPDRGDGDGFDLVSPGPDFPDEVSVSDAVDAIDGDDAVIRTDIPVTRDNQREAVSDTLQRAVGLNPEKTGAPLRETIKTGEDKFADAAGIQKDGTIAALEGDRQRDGRGGGGGGGGGGDGANTAAAGGAATAATVALAAPEPVSSTIGAGVLGGLALGGGITAASNEAFGDEDGVAQPNQDIPELNIPERRPSERQVELNLPDDRTPADTNPELGTPERRNPADTGGELDVPEDRTPTDTSGELGTPEADESTPGVNAPIEATPQQAVNLPQEDADEEELDENDDPFADRGRVQERRQQERNEIARQAREQQLFEQRERFGEIERESIPVDQDSFSGEVPADQTPEIEGVGDPQTFGEREETFEERFQREVLEEEQQTTRQRLRQRQQQEQDEVADLRELSQERFDARTEGDQFDDTDTGVGPRGDNDLGPRAAATGVLDDLLSTGQSELFDDSGSDTDEMLDEMTETQEKTLDITDATETADITEFGFGDETATQTQPTTPVVMATTTAGPDGSQQRRKPELPDIEMDRKKEEIDLQDVKEDEEIFSTGIEDPDSVLDDVFGGEQ